MDLTPPSMIPSPTLSYTASSQSSNCGFDPACPLEAAAASYPSPHLLDLNHELSSLSRSFNFLANKQNAGNCLPGEMADSEWKYSATASEEFPAIHVSSSSTGPDVLAAGYDPFGGYEAELSPVQYVPAGGYLASSGSCTSARAPSHMSQNDLASNSSTSFRAPFGFAPHSMTQAVKMDVDSLRGPSLGAAPYPVSGALPGHYPPPMSSFHLATPQFIAESSVTSWETQGCEASQLQGSQPAQCERPGTTSTATRSASLTRSRRGSRKHTTKEEANFQCSVEGCGKFFSRSYNFKSHMETHDEQREYPFPCLVSGCDKKFVRKTDLQRHHQSVHKKERNHRCDFCGRLFARKDTLRRHMEDGCSKRFDIGTMDLRSENHGHEAMDPAERARRSGSDRVASTRSLLPAMSPSQAASLQPLRVTEMEQYTPASAQVWGR